MDLKQVELLKKQYMEEMTSMFSFTEEEIAVIQSISIFRVYNKGTILLKEGQFSNVSYTLIKGCLKSYYVMDGEEIVTTFYIEKDTFLPSRLQSKKPSLHYLACLEDCLVSISTPEMEQIMLEKFPRFEKFCLLSAEEKLARIQVEFDEFKTSTPEDRYLKLLEIKPELFQRIPQYLIASYLGIKPESLSRIRQRIIFKPEKKLSYSY